MTLPSEAPAHPHPRQLKTYLPFVAVLKRSVLSDPTSLRGFNISHANLGSR